MPAPIWENFLESGAQCDTRMEELELFSVDDFSNTHKDSLLASLERAKDVIQHHETNEGHVDSVFHALTLAGVNFDTPIDAGLGQADLGLGIPETPMQQPRALTVSCDTEPAATGAGSGL